jgi:prepilin-type N-terminal cleavage/methylation domain-containing protein
VNQFDRKRRRAGFTLVELATAIVIIVVLLGLTGLAVSRGLLTARAAAERQTLTGLNAAITQFKADFGFLPPLIADERFSQPGPCRLESGSFIPWSVQSGVGAAPGADPDALARVVSAASWDTDQKRYSVYSLAYYLTGALDAPRATDPRDVIDGATGPKIRTPSPEGVFARSGKTHDALFDVTQTGRNRLAYVRSTPTGADQEYGVTPQASTDEERRRPTLVDRWGQPIRYYRWKPTFAITGDRRGEVSEYNVPRALGDPWVASGAALRGAEYALLITGPDRRTDERWPFMNPSPQPGSPSAPPSDPDAEASTKDDIVEFGR